MLVLSDTASRSFAWCVILVSNSNYYERKAGMADGADGVRGARAAKDILPPDQTSYLYVTR